MDTDLTLLNAKVDRLTELVEVQVKRQQAWDEFQQDMIPIANHMIKLSIDELAEIGNDFELEDLLFLLKRILRDTHMLLSALDRLEALMGLVSEGELLGKQMFHQAVEKLDEMEHEGYFAFARGGWYITERIVKEFTEEDVRALGDNIGTILTTVRNMTQPEVLALANNAIGAMRSETPESDQVSIWRLLKEFSDPKVRKGLSRMLNMVKAMADQPGQENIN